MKLNNKGYMLVEIIVSFALTFAIMISMINLVLSFKNKNEDIYYEAKYLKDKNLITRNIMDDFKKNNIKSLEKVGNNLLFKIERLNEQKKIIEENRKLAIDNNTITYGMYDEDNGNFIMSDASYYTNKLEPSLKIEGIEYKINEYNIYIKIKVRSIYSDESYDINLFSLTTNLKLEEDRECGIFTNYYFLGALFNYNYDYFGTLDILPLESTTTGANVLADGVELKEGTETKLSYVCLTKDSDIESYCEKFENKENIEKMDLETFYQLHKYALSEKNPYIYINSFGEEESVKIYTDPKDIKKKYIIHGKWSSGNLGGDDANKHKTIIETEVKKLVDASILPEELSVTIVKYEDRIDMNIRREISKEKFKKNNNIPIEGYMGEENEKKAVLISPAMYKYEYEACEKIWVQKN